MNNASKFTIVLFVICMIGAIGAHSKTLTFKEAKNEWNKLSQWQKKQSLQIFNRAKVDNLSWTASAIAWEESTYGTYQININNNSYDCGVFGNNTRSVAAHLDQKHSYYNKKAICTDLIRDEQYSYQWFIVEVELWKRVHKGKWNMWRKVWESYNGGHIGNKDYGQRISMRIKVLKEVLDIK